MPLHGKIVVIKRSGGDGTEFPLTATCLFGRKPDCDIRIQLPQVSKEHCRIDLNENKEVILTNLSSVNPTLVNGEVLQQSERLKHGDLITIIDRSFRFEYPPAPTPKKRSSTGGKVLQDQQVGETVTVETDEKRSSQVCTDLHLKDGTNHDNIQRCLDKTVEVVSKEDGSLLQNKAASPFSDLYQMIKKSLDVSTPLKSSASMLQTPTSRFCTPKPGSVVKNVGRPVSKKSTPKKAEDKDLSESDETKGQADSLGNGTPKLVKKQRGSFQVPAAEMAGTAEEDGSHLHQKRNSATPKTFTVHEVIEKVAVQKSPVRRRSKETTSVTLEQEKPRVTAPTADHLQKASPKTSGNVEKEKGQSRKRKSGELAADLPKSQMKKKRVSFGGYLSPELFDKRLPPDSPLRKGAAPRRSLCLVKPKLSLLSRRASVIGNLKEFEDNGSNLQSLAKLRTPSPAKKSPKSKTPSPKAASPAKKSPKSKIPSPKAASPAKKSPKSRTPSPNAATPANKSPKSKSPSPKAATPAKKSPKSKSPSPKAATPAIKSPKSKTPLAKKSPKAKVLSSINNIQTKSQCVSSTSSPGPMAFQKTPTGRKRSSMIVPIPAQENYPIVVLTNLNSGVQTPSVRGRFSVSRISTPSPVASEAFSDQVPSITVTPKIPLRRTSMKSASRKTPSVGKSAVKVMLRKSGISRASMKAMNSWADIVKFGQTKTRVAAAAKIMVTKKPLKKALSKPQTPARKVIGHVSTGHADSPVTIVVGQAHKKKVVPSTGAAPRVVPNIALYKMDMKMDEDLTGVSEMFKTPVNERKRRSVINDSSIIQTPIGSQGISVVEPSVLATPEEPGEMMVSPLSIESTAKRIQYNNEAVQRLLDANQESSFVNDVPALVIHSESSQQKSTTPKQKPAPQECLTGVKRIMKTPKQKAEPVEDLRGKLLKTPKQKPEHKECLTGVKRIMKTPKQKAEAVEDIRGRLLVTPKQKLQQQECLTGVKRIMKTPKEKSAPVEDMVGVKRLVKTPKEKSRPVERNFGIKRLMKSPRLRGNAPVEDFEGLQKLLEEPQTESVRHMETNEVEDKAELDCGLKVSDEINVHEDPQDSLPTLACTIINVPAVDMPQVFKSHMDEEPSGPERNESLDAIETISQAVIDGDLHLEKPKGLTNMNSSEEQPEVEATSTQVSELESTSNEYRKKSTGSKRGQSKEVKDEKEATEHSEEHVIPVPLRGRRRAKTETTAPPTVRQPTRNRSTKNAENKNATLTVEESTPQPSKACVKPKRGKNAAKVSEAPTESETVPEAELSQESQSVPGTFNDNVHPSNMTEDAQEVHSDQLEAPVSESLPQIDTASCEQTDLHVIQKRPVRGRRAKIVESKAAEKKQEAKPLENSALLTLVRGKRGNKTEATAPSALRKTTNKRNAKSLENPLETLVTENSAEAIDDQTSATETSQEETCPAVEAVMKPKERKTKTLVKQQSEPKNNEAVNDQQLVADAQPEQLINIIAKPRRGRKINPGTVEQVAEDAAVTKQQTQPATRAKRGRNAQQEEGNNDGKTNFTETSQLEGPVKKLRRTRKADQDNVEPSKEEEIQNAEVVEDKDEASLAETKKTNEQPAVAIKPRRGGRKTKQGTESETSVKSMEIKTAPAICPAEKPKRGRRGKQVNEESGITTDVSEEKIEQKLEAEDSDPNVSVIKSSSAREVKTDVSQAIPCKRARRGAALPIEVSNRESTVQDSEPALRSTGPAKRGRRAAAKATDGVTVSSDLAHPPEDVSSAAVEDSKMSKRTVKWKADLEDFEIPKAKSGRAVGARRSKPADQAEGDTNKSEEEDLSDKKAEALPIKRARRGAKVTDQAEIPNKVEDAEAEMQPKVRRGRSAKK